MNIQPIGVMPQANYRSNNNKQNTTFGMSNDLLQLDYIIKQTRKLNPNIPEEEIITMAKKTLNDLQKDATVGEIFKLDAYSSSKK